VGMVGGEVRLRRAGKGYTAQVEKSCLVSY